MENRAFFLYHSLHIQPACLQRKQKSNQVQMCFLHEWNGQRNPLPFGEKDPHKFSIPQSLSMLEIEQKIHGLFPERAKKITAVLIADRTQDL